MLIRLTKLTLDKKTGMSIESRQGINTKKLITIKEVVLDVKDLNGSLVKQAATSVWLEGNVEMIVKESFDQVEMAFNKIEKE